MTKLQSRATHAIAGLALAIVALGTLVNSSSVGAQEANPGAACQALLALNLDDLPDGASARVASAALVTVGAEGLPAPAALLNWSFDSARGKQYCEVSGYVARQNQFVLRLPLPADWNRKFFFISCDGFCGRLQPARLNPGLVEGYASVNSDGGHSSAVFDGIWGDHDPALQEDFAFRGNHSVTIAAKAITTAYYKQPIRRSYMAGFSKGGQATLMAAQRYPQDFDGLVIGAPVYQLTDTVTIRMAWTAKANTDGKGGVLIDANAAALLHKGALAACDANDGIADQLIYDPAHCAFKPSTLLCRTAAVSDCLTAAQVAAAEKIYARPTDSAGKPIYNTGQAIGSETSWAAWVYPNGRRDLNTEVYYNFVRYLAFEGAPPSGLSTEALPRPYFQPGSFANRWKPLRPPARPFDGGDWCVGRI